MEAAGTAAREQKRGRGKLALKGGGGGGLLFAGGVLIAAGTAVAIRRAWKRRPLPSSRPAEEIKGFDGENRMEKQSQTGRKGYNIQEKISVSKNPDLVEQKENDCVLPTEFGEKEVRSIDQIKKQTSEESECVLVDGMEKEINVDLIQSHTDVSQNLTAQVSEKSEFILVDEVGKEKKDVSEISSIDDFKEVEESLPSESDVALDNRELKKAKTEITELDDERTACIEHISELVSTAAQKIRAELVSAATGDIKNEEPGSELTDCVDEIAEVMLAATRGINKKDCHSVHNCSENKENSSDERTACTDKEEVNEGVQSNNLEVGMAENHSNCIRDETESVPTKEIKREEEILLQEPQAKIESEINEQKEVETSSTEIRAESKTQLQSSQEDEHTTESGYDIEEKEEGKFSRTEHQPQSIVKRVQFSVVKEIHKIRKEKEEAEESESSAEMRKEESNSIVVSFEVSSTETVCPIEVIGHKESIMVKKFHPSDNDQRERKCKGENDALGEIEDDGEEQKESTGSLMDHYHNRLFTVLLGLTLILGILCFFNSSHLTTLSFQLYQVIFPAVEETRQIEL